ncbi:MAG: rRNA maturation RNase YbeY [Firmicutes bacterium]|uniref:Endoribonuclease YbeY n=1 Tax=Candidatus Gallilactobacillus intestinavium TaxID=2840838 RepID=A0A9D9E6X4_9LACO|nr:rRNA maturation RNase YbeY [Candidatus Gallilactobacillus intestinavium]
MNLEIFDKTKQKMDEQDLKLVKNLLDFASQKLGLTDDTEMSVTFMNNDEIQQINRQYRGLNKPTDVISFAIEEDPDEEDVINFDDELMKEIPRNLGDIFVSIDKVHEQALDLGHSNQRELGFLVVHGFLHLNGYDHMRPTDEDEMFSLQREILDDYGLIR